MVVRPRRGRARPRGRADRHGARIRRARLVDVGDFDSPMHVTAPPNDPRLFVVEQPGRVKVISGGTVKTFLDVTAITNTTGSNERGLLSIAFPPDYATSGLFYVYLTGAGGRCRSTSTTAPPIPTWPTPHRAGGSSRSRTPRRATTTAASSRSAPTGCLYVGTGDGGSSNDTPTADAEHPDSLLGKILRIDPRGAAPAPTPSRRQPVRQRGLGVRAAQPVALLLRPRQRRPRDRRRRPGPSRGDRLRARRRRARARRELRLALLRGHDPHDRRTPTLRRAPRRCATRPSPAGDQDRPGDRFHAHDRRLLLDHGRLRRARPRAAHARRAATSTGTSASASCARWSLSDPASDAAAGVTLGSPTSFGEDACGRVYVAAREGAVFRIEDGAATALRPHAARGTPGGGSGGPGRPGPDTRKPSLSVRVRGLPSLVSRRRLRVSLVSDELTAATVSGRLRGVARFKTVRRQLTASKRRVIVPARSRASPRASCGARVRRHRVKIAADRAGPRRRRQPARRDPPPDAAPLVS